MILVEGVGFAPLTFLLMSAVLRSTDASFEEAAHDGGRRPAARPSASITLRLGLPGVLALMLLIVIRAFESFEVPGAGRAGRQRHGADHQHLSELEEHRRCRISASPAPMRSASC